MLAPLEVRCCGEDGRSLADDGVRIAVAWQERRLLADDDERDKRGGHGSIKANPTDGYPQWGDE